MNKHLLGSLTSAFLPFCAASFTTTSFSYHRSYFNCCAASHVINHSKRHLELQKLHSAGYDSSINQKFLNEYDSSTELMLSSEFGSSAKHKLSINSSVAIDNETRERDLLVITQGSVVRELMVIDEAVTDKHLFYQQLKPGVDIVEINSSIDGLEQLESKLKHYQNLSALHIVSHANDGVLYLGSSQVTKTSLENRLNVLASMNHALNDGADVLFYGCNLAKSVKGEALLELISNEANVDVAASNNITGDPLKQGDWELEIRKGDIETKPAYNSIAMKNFRSILAFNGTLNLDNVPTGYAASKSYMIPVTSYQINFTSSASGGNDLYNFAAGYVYVGTGSSTQTSTTISFASGELFDLTSMFVYNSDTLSRVIRVTSNKGGSVDSGSLSQNASETLNFSGAQWEQVSTVTIQYDNGATLDWTRIDDITLANLALPNAAPAIANLNGDSFTYTEDVDSQTVIDQGTALTVTDGDSADFNGGNLTVTITSGEDASEDTLDLSTSGTVALAGTTAGSNVSVGVSVVGTLGNNIAAGNDLVVNFTSSNATPASVQTLARAVTYQNSDTDNPTTGARNVRLTVNDGDGDTSSNQDVTITVARTNDAPSISNLNGDSFSYLQGAGASNVDQGTAAVLSDVDSLTDFNGGNLTVTITSGEDAAEDRLSIDGTVTLGGMTAGSSVTVGGFIIGTLGNNVAVGNDFVVNFGANATLSRVQTLLQAVTYENTDGITATSGARNVRLTVNDGDGGTSANQDVTVTVIVPDTDGDLTSAAVVSEPVNLAWSVDTVGEAVDLFDFTLTDNGTADGLPMTVSQVVVNVTGTASDTDRDKVTWRLNSNSPNNDVSNVTGVYNSGANTITFSTPSLSVADGTSEILTINGYYNDNTGLTHGETIILSVDGDTDLTVGGSNTQMGATTAISNSTGTVIIDDLAPIITSVSVPANSTYTAAANLDFTVNLNETVTVNTGSGTPRIPLTVGATTRYADYITGSPGTSLVFRYTVPLGDEDLNGIAASASVDTNLGTIQDSAGNGINTTLNSVGSLSSVLVDALAPVVAEVTPVVTPGTDSTPDVTFSTTEAGSLAVGGSCGSGDEGAVSSGNQTITLTQPDNSSSLTVGSYTDCTVSVTDSAGNASNVLTLSSFEIDNTMPTLDTNLGLGLDEGDIGATITGTELSASDNVSAAANVTYTLVSAPSNGTLRNGGGALSGGGTFTQANINTNAVTYDHDGSETLSDTFTFTLLDGAGNINNNSAANFTFNFTVAAVNDAPSTTVDSDSVNEDNAVAIDVLSNDSDVDGTIVASTVTVVSAPSNGGTAVNSGTGVITYTPTANFNGSDSFSYTVEDNSGAVSSATNVSVTVNPVNDPPVAVIDPVSTPQNVTLSIDVAANDSDIDVGDSPDPATIAVASAPSNGSAVFNGGTNRIDYTPTNGFNGVDSFTYTIDDSNGATSNPAGIVNVTVGDILAPIITAVSIPNNAHIVGDTVTATITVVSDTDNYTLGSGGVGGTINGYSLGSLAKVNNTTYTASFTIIDGGTDVLGSANLAVNVTLADSVGNTSTAFTTAISQANDPIFANLPDVDLTSSSSILAEDGGAATLTATLSGSLNNQWPVDVTVNLSYTGTATIVTDYTAASAITVSAGGSTGTTNVTSLADTLFDATLSETIIVDIGSLSVGNEGAINQQTLSITDADTAPTVTLSVANNSIVENGGTSSITATLSNPTFEDVTVNLAYSGTAVSGGIDYNTPSSAITVSGGSVSANAVTGLTATDDANADGDLSIIIDISSVSGGGATESSVQQQTVTLVDDEDGIAPVISAVNITDSVHKVGDVVVATISVSSDTDDYTSGSGGLNGTINGYVLGGLTKVNDTTYTASFTITDGGTDVSGSSDIAVNFTVADSSGNISSAFTAPISQSNDTIFANVPDVDLTSSSNTLAEDGGSATLTATLSGSLNNQWPVNIVVNLAYTGTATNTADYTAAGSITVNTGSSIGTTAVTSLADSLFDAIIAETIIVDIDSLSVGNEGTINQQSLSIIDAESAPSVTLSVGDNSINENGGTSSITVTLSNPTFEDVTVNLAYGGTAVSGGTDYNTPSASIVITGGGLTTDAVTGITAVNDVSADGDLTIVLDIASVTGGGATENSVQQQTVTILDDENRTPVITSSPATSVNQDDLYSYTVTATDDDVGDILTLSAPVLPAWLTFTPASGLLTGTPVDANVGAHNVTLRVNDGSIDVDQIFVITVVNVNDLPSGLPTITGNLVRTEILSVDVSAIADDDGLGTFSYQWQRSSSPISGETNSTYTLDEVDIGQRMSVVVSYTDARGTAESLTSLETDIVVDLDSDNDGIPDLVEGTGDSDNDGIPDFLDTDSDGDGLLDIDEGNGDSDSDGIPNYLDTSLDEDGDSIPDLFDGDANSDSDGDGLNNAFDTDSDNDGISDFEESGALGTDADNDGIDDAFDVDFTGGVDTDNDGIDDASALVDSDGDSIPDYIDRDSDNDSVPDVLENSTGIAINRQKSKLLNAEMKKTVMTVSDTDSDGTPDYRDTDSDEDGVSDLAEAPVTVIDSDMDQIIDLYDVDSTGGVDANGDGVDDAATLLNSDNDLTPNQFDLDSDNDGVLDVLEAGFNDLDRNGLLDTGDMSTDFPVDSDLDGLNDFIDLDSNDDGTFDIRNSGAATLDENMNGQIDDVFSLDSDGDGIVNLMDDELNQFGTRADRDLDGVPSSIDLDDDGDGISDLVEGNMDSDGDGLVNALDNDSDNDGLSDSFEALLPARLNQDVDRDGIDDRYDVDFTGGSDSNSDGIDDQFTGLDTDSDGLPDYLDTDSDNDSILDTEEQLSVMLTGIDSDSDGLDDALDIDNTQGTDANFDGQDDQTITDNDIDGDGLLAYRDPDTDGDGINDIDENGDFNQDGINDRLQAEREVTATSGGGAFGMFSLILLGIIRVKRITKKVNKINLENQNEIKNTSQKAGALLCVLLFISINLNAKENCNGVEPSESISLCWYLGVGAVSSSFEPQVSGSSWRVDDDNGSGGKVFVGADINHNWFAEISYAEFGEAKLSNVNPNFQQTGTIDYQMNDIVVGYRIPFGSDQFDFNVKAGFASVSTESSFIEGDTVSFGTLGVSGRWLATQYLSLSLSYDIYGDDISALSVNLSTYF